MKILHIAAFLPFILLPILSNAGEVTVHNKTDHKVVIENLAQTKIHTIAKNGKQPVWTKNFKNFIAYWSYKGTNIGGTVQCSIEPGINKVFLSGNCSMDKKTKKCASGAIMKKVYGCVYE